MESEESLSDRLCCLFAISMEDGNHHSGYVVTRQSPVMAFTCDQVSGAEREPEIEASVTLTCGRQGLPTGRSRHEHQFLSHFGVRDELRDCWPGTNIHD